MHEDRPGLVIPDRPQFAFRTRPAEFDERLLYEVKALRGGDDVEVDAAGVGLGFGGVGLQIAGAAAAHITKRPLWLGSVRQLALGAIAIGATYFVGYLIGGVVT